MNSRFDISQNKGSVDSAMEHSPQGSYLGAKQMAGFHLSLHPAYLPVFDNLYNHSEWERLRTSAATPDDEETVHFFEAVLKRLKGGLLFEEFARYINETQRGTEKTLSGLRKTVKLELDKAIQSIHRNMNMRPS